MKFFGIKSLFIVLFLNLGFSEFVCSQKEFFKLSDTNFTIDQVFQGGLDVRFPTCIPYFLVGDQDANESLLLDSLITFMNAHPNLVFQIETHTDNRGTSESNQVLSERRAIQIGQYFLEKGGSNHQLRWKGFGEEQPKKVFFQNGEYFSFKPENGSSFEEIFLTEEYINQFKLTDKRTFEILHQMNWRTEIRIVAILN